MSKIDSTCIKINDELESVPIYIEGGQFDKALQNVERAVYLSGVILSEIKRMRDNYDPTPYCGICKAMDAAHCDCPPPSDNE